MRTLQNDSFQLTSLRGANCRRTGKFRTQSTLYDIPASGFPQYGASFVLPNSKSAKQLDINRVRDFRAGVVSTPADGVYTGTPYTDTGAFPGYVERALIVWYNVRRLPSAGFSIVAVLDSGGAHGAHLLQDDVADALHEQRCVASILYFSLD